MMSLSVQHIIRMVTSIILLSLAVSCSTSNNVVSNKLFQKRKYQKGWHINKPTKLPEKTDKQPNEEIAKVDEKVQVTEYSDEVTVEYSAIKKKLADSKEQIVEVYQIEKGPSLLGEKVSLKESRGDLSQVYVASDYNSTQAVSGLTQLYSPPIDRSDGLTRFLLALLGFIVLFFTTISPLAVLIALGRGEASRINTMIYLLAVFLAIVGIALLIITGGTAIAVLIPLYASIIIWLVSVVHAIFSIIRGY